MNWKGTGWYRVSGQAGTEIPMFKALPKSCTTYGSGYTLGPLPQNPGQIVNTQACFSHPINPKCQEMKIKHCGSYFLYFLQDVPYTAYKMSYRYCGHFGISGWCLYNL